MLVILASIVISLNVFLQGADAFSGEGDGTTSNPYLITNCQELQDIQDDLSATYAIANNIDCSDTYYWNEGDGFVPIGYSTGEPFTGSIEGNNHVITGIHEVRTGFDVADGHVGLLYSAENATIHDLAINDSYFIGWANGGSFVASAIDTTLTNVSSNSTVDVTGSTIGIGGLVGRLDNFITDNRELSVISRSKFTGSIRGDYRVGGLVGVITHGSIDNSYSSFTSYAVENGQMYGGIAGLAWATDIFNSYSSSTVDLGDAQGVFYIGGLVGFMAEYTNITNSFAVGANPLQTLNHGGIAGYNVDETSTMTNVHYDATATGQAGCVDTVAFDGCTAQNTDGESSDYFTKKTNAPMNSWDLTATWIVNNALPIFGISEPEESETGTPVYTITTCEELQSMQWDLDGDYTLANDIDCSDSDGWNEGEAFEPIGNDEEDFTGTLDGHGFTIIELNTRYEDNNSGLFYSLRDSTITNLQFEEPQITGNLNNGTLAGEAHNSTISRIVVRNTYIGHSSEIVHATGGIIGVLDADNGGSSSLTESYLEGQVYGDAHVGSLVGILGENATLSNSYVGPNAEVRGGEYVGGLVGYTQGTILNSYTLSAVAGSGHVGGLTGYLSGRIVGSFFANARADMTTDEGQGYGIVAVLDYQNGGEIENTFYDDYETIPEDDDDEDQYDDIDCADVIQFCTGTQKNSDNSQFGYFQNYDTDDPIRSWDTGVWRFTQTAYPLLRWMNADHTISNCTELQAIDDDLSAYYTLTQDIDCSDTVNWNDGEGFSPISELGDGDFTGGLDGQNHTITGLYIHHSGEVGLFKETDSAIISNLSINDSEIHGEQRAGAIVGDADYTILENVHSNAIVTSDEINGYTGGLVGDLRGTNNSSYRASIISNSSFTGHIIGDGYVGGLAGYASRSIIKDSYTQATVINMSPASTGGIVGILINSILMRSYAASTVEAPDDEGYTGGLVGRARDESDIRNNFSASSVTAGEYPGDILGRDTSGDVTLTNNYYDASISHFGCQERSDNAGCTAVNADGAQPHYFFNSTTSQPLDQWNFDTIWVMHAANYPDFGPADPAVITDSPKDTSDKPPISQKRTSFAVTNSSSTTTNITPTEQKTILNDFNEFSNGTGKSLSLTVGQVVYFTVGGHEYSATVKAIEDGYVDLILGSTSQEIRLAINKIGRYDVTRDGVDDIEITLVSITSGVAQFTFKQLEVNYNTNVETKTSTPNYWWIYILVALAVGGTTIAIVTYKRSKR